MENLAEFVKTAKFLNHLNFSGMNFGKDQIRELLEILHNC